MSNPTSQAAPGHNKPVTITVNTRPHTVTKDRYTYEEIVALAYPTPDFEANLYKVTYFRETGKNDDHPVERSLTKGQSVEVLDGMVFTVVKDIKS